MTHPDPQYFVLNTIIIFNAVVWNQTIIASVMPRHKHKLNLLCGFVLIVALLQRVYGIKNFLNDSKLFGLFLSILVIIIGLPFYIYINQKLHNLNLSIVIDANKSHKEM